MLHLHVQYIHYAANCCTTKCRKLIGARYFNKGYAFYAGTLNSSSFYEDF